MINIIVTSDPRYPVNKLLIQTTILGIIQKYRITGSVEIGISVVGDRKMHEINKKYRGIDQTTNILSFAYEDPLPSDQLLHTQRLGFIKSPDKKLRLGDILISWPALLGDAAADGVTTDEELRQLVEHGTKHLIGIHH